MSAALLQKKDSAATRPQFAASAADAAVVRGLVNHCILQRDMDVAAISVCRRDVIVHKRMPEGVVVGANGTGGARGEIKEFSNQSRYRLLFTVKNCQTDFRSMLTLTYPAAFPVDGKRVKRDLEAMRGRLLRQFPEITGVWFLEFQKRGAPHYHLLLSVDLSKGQVIQRQRTRKPRDSKKKSMFYRTCPLLERWAARAWYEIVDSGDEKHLHAGVSWEILEKEDAAIRYAATHAGKPHQKKVPENYRNVGRFWGKIGEIRIEISGRLEVSAEEIFSRVGHEAMSSRGRVKKYLFDFSMVFSVDVAFERDCELALKLEQVELIPVDDGPAKRVA
jgi:hypothetical protein